MSNTKTYDVVMPIVGEVYVRVKVPKDADKDDIWEAAEDQYSEDEKNGEEQIAWEFHQKITEGNVCSVSTTEWSYEEICPDCVQAINFCECYGEKKGPWPE